MASLAGEEPVEEKWYRALYEGDCVQVMRLLENKPSLLKVGCSNEPSREVEGRDLHVWSPWRSSSTWKGRNALHVAAWRGCVKLILQVLDLCDLTETNDHSGVDGQGVEAVEGEGSEDIAAPRGVQSDQAESNGAGGNDHNVAPNGESSGGGQQNVLEIVSPADATGLSVSSTRALSEQPIQPPPRPTGPHSEDHDGKRSNTSSGYSLSRKDLREWLSTEDGFFGLRPFTMAGFHFSVDVLVLLGYAYGKCDTSGDPWKITTKVRRIELSPAALVDVEDAVYRDRRARLRKATEDVMKTFDDVRLTSLKEKYSADREFNFLPIEEYLFHFLFVPNVPFVSHDTDAGRALWREVRSSQDVELWRFLLQLYDGQGRTPFHVAIKGAANIINSAEYFVGLVKDGRADEREVLLCALTTPDTASRTPAHRAATNDQTGALGVSFSIYGTNALGVILKHSKTYEEIAATCHGSRTVAEDIMSYFKASGGSLSGKKPSEDYSHCLDLATILLAGERYQKGYIEYRHRRSDKPFHAAMLTKSYNSVKLLVHESCEISYSEKCGRSGTTGRFSSECGQKLSERVDAIEYDEMEFACLVGADVECLQSLKEGLDKNATERNQPQGSIAGALKHVLTNIWEIMRQKGLDGSVIQRNQQQGSIAGALKHVLTNIWEIMQQKGLDGSVIRRNQQQGYQAKRFTRKYAKDSEGETKITLQHPWPALHLAAFSGNYDSLKLLIDDLQCDPFIKDFEGNTALHHAMMVRTFQCEPKLLDFVSCEEFKYFQDKIEKKKGSSLEDQKTWEKNQIVQRQGCINLLLQAGCDVFKPNNNKQIPYPQGSLSSNAEFLSWWYDKQEKEFVATQNNLNFAANATSITAALVATASYVGPLTPPMGYAGDPNQLQDQNIWVILFIVCDTISFYLAVAAITLSLIPSLPMPQHSMRVELERTRKMLTRAVVVLLPAIMFVFLAFGASSFAVLSASIISSTAGRLVIATTCIGGLICLATFFSFFIRLIACIFPGNSWVRYFYDITSI